MDRYELAWLIWAYQQGYMTPEDREDLKNWLRDPEDTMTPNDILQRDSFLEIADSFISVVKEELETARKNEFEPREQWRVLDQNGELKWESTNKGDVLVFMKMGCTMQRLYEKEEREWRNEE